MQHIFTITVGIIIMLQFTTENSQLLMFSNITFQKRSKFCYYLRFPSFCFFDRKPSGLYLCFVMRKCNKLFCSSIYLFLNLEEWNVDAFKRYDISPWSVITKEFLKAVIKVKCIKGSLHTTIFSKYTELLQLKKIFLENFEIIFKIL